MTCLEALTGSGEGGANCLAGISANLLYDLGDFFELVGELVNKLLDVPGVAHVCYLLRLRFCKGRRARNSSSKSCIYSVGG